MPRPDLAPPDSRASRSDQSRRAYDLLRALVGAKHTVADAQLVEDDLIRSHGFSRSVIREALQLLASEGIVSRQRRTGTRITQPVIRLPMDDLLPSTTGSSLSVVRIDCRTVRATPAIREALGTDDLDVGVVEHVFFAGGEAIGIRTSYFRATFTQPEAWDQCPTLGAAFEFVYGSPLAGVRTVVSAAEATPATAAALGIAPGSPILTREQMLIDRDGVTQELTFSHYRADRVTYTSTETRLPRSSRAA